MSTTTAKITTRTRSLGYGWTTQPERNRAAIVEVTAPDVVGGLRAVEAERTKHLRAVSGGAWSNAALFLGGKRVVAAGWEISQILAEVRQFGETTVTIER